MTSPNLMVIGLQIRKLDGGGGGRNLPPQAVLDSKKPGLFRVKDSGQQKVGSKSRNNSTNLQTLCKTNIRIWDCFCHNCFGNRHHQNTKSPELFY